RDPLRSRAGRLGIGKIDLLDVAALGRRIADTSLLIDALDVRFGDLDPARLLARNEGYHHQLAVLGRAEQVLAFLEVLCEHIRRRRRNVAGLRVVKQHVFDRTLLVLIAIYRLDQGLRRVQSRCDGGGELPAQHLAALFRDKTSLGESRRANGLLEAEAVEL